jgi:MurNAc alpha-1-phosphate uridylyltransferase
MSRFSAPLALRPKPQAALPEAAMVLSAGLGKRMRPLTVTRPKPLVEVAGRTLLDRVLDHIRAAGIGRVVVNVHYLADAVEAHLAARDQDLDLRISDERSLLMETGGGVLQALPLIDADPFLVVNSDNLWVDGPVDAISLLADRWDPAAMDALLLVVPLARAACHSGPGDFHMDPVGRLSRRRPGRIAPFVFTGVQIVARRLFDDPPAGPFSFNVLWNRAIAAGRCYGVVHQGLWFDVGTPPAVRATEDMLADG